MWDVDIDKRAQVGRFPSGLFLVLNSRRAPGAACGWRGRGRVGEWLPLIARRGRWLRRRLGRGACGGEREEAQEAGGLLPRVPRITVRDTPAAAGARKAAGSRIGVTGRRALQIHRLLHHDHTRRGCGGLHRHFLRLADRWKSITKNPAMNTEEIRMSLPDAKVGVGDQGSMGLSIRDDGHHVERNVTVHVEPRAPVARGRYCPSRGTAMFNSLRLPLLDDSRVLLSWSSV